MPSKTFRYFVVCVLSFMTINAARAVDRDWNKATGVQVFNTAANWDPSAIPAAGDFLTFGLDGDVDIFLGAPSVGGNIHFTDGIVEFLDVGGSTLNSGGNVRIDDEFAAGLGDGAQVTVSGPTWNNVGIVNVANIGFGSLTLNGGSDLTGSQILVGNTSGAVGEVTLTGTGTTLTASLNGNTGVHVIGNGGTGTLHVLSDADLRTTSTSGNDIWVGNGAGSVGTLNVDGVGSFAETEDLNVGISGGTGFLSITGGAQVINTDGGVNGSPDTTFGATGAASQGTGVVDGNGSLLRSRSIFVGFDGVGRLEVKSGGLARTLQQGTSVGDMIIGNNTGSDGKVAVFGSGFAASLLDVDDSLYVGDAGLGVLNIGRDLDDNEVGMGALQVDVDLRIGDNTTNTNANKVVVDGANATANVDSVTYAGLSGTGTLEVTGGAQFTGRFLRVGQNSTSNGTLLIDGPNSLLDTDADVTDVTDDTVIGTSGTGDATVSNGGRLNTDELWVGYQGTGIGTLTIDNATVNAGVDNASTGSDLVIGGRTDVANAGGTGSVTVQNGGLLTSRALTIIGGNATATGTLTVTGPGSLLDNSDNAPNGAPDDTLRVGQNSGTAFLNILDGGRLDTEAVWTGLGGGTNAADVVVDGAGSTFNVDNFLRIGDGRRSTFTVSNGGTLNVAVSAQAGVDNNQLMVGYLDGGDGATLTVNGAGSLVDFFGNERISAGVAGGSTTNRATIEVLAGGRLNAVQRDAGNAVVSSGFLMVGDTTGSHGQVTVDGTASRVDVRHMQVGDGPSNSSGIVDITGGGLITTLDHVEAGSNGAGVGTINVAGLGSRLEVGSYLSLGDDAPGDGPATGNLNVTAGGVVTNGGQAYIGHFTGSFGTATLGSATADVSTWQIGGELTLAGTEASSQLSGSGVLNVNTGGRVAVASNLRIRNLGDVNLNGGEIRVGDEIIYSDAGSTFNFVTGTLRFTEAGAHTLDFAQVDRLLGASPTLVSDQHLAVDSTAVLATPLRLNGGTFSVGAITPANLANLDWDAGTLNVTAQNVVVGAAGLLGASVVVDEDQSLGVPNTNLTVQAGADLNIIRGGLSTADATNEGLVVISNTAAVDFDSNGSGGGLTNNGDLVVIDSTVAGNVINNGVLEIVGDVTFTDNVTLSALGSVGIDLGGSQVGEFDTLTSSSFLTLDGTLNVSLDGGFVPQLGDSFGVLRGEAGFTGSFDTLNLPALNPGLAWQLNPGAITVFLNVISSSSSPGDFDGDGDVDGRDFLIWQRGGSPNPLSASDLAVWQANYGLDALLQTHTAAAESSVMGASPVPEPSCLALVVGLIVACRGRRSHIQGIVAGSPSAIVESRR